MKLAIGADHHGFFHKEYIKKNLSLSDPIEWIDVGAADQNRSDYPLFAHKVARMVQAGEADGGILLCGTGVGMAVVANRYPGVYAALAWNSVVAMQSKEHDKSNVLVIPADYVSEHEAVNMIEHWVRAEFNGGRYQDRVAMIDKKSDE